MTCKSVVCLWHGHHLRAHTRSTAHTVRSSVGQRECVNAVCPHRANLSNVHVLRGMLCLATLTRAYASRQQYAEGCCADLVGGSEFQFLGAAVNCCTWKCDRDRTIDLTGDLTKACCTESGVRCLALSFSAASQMNSVMLDLECFRPQEIQHCALRCARFHSGLWRCSPAARYKRGSRYRQTSQS